jgi:hypothetical protein
MQGVKKLPRQEKSPYKPSSLWDTRENAIFLRYCPSKRDKCYHAMANDMSARPHEILDLKIKDIIFKATEDGIQFAEVLITGGKTKPRTLPLIDSIPYLKDWILDHPTGTNPDSWLFVSLANNTFGSKLTYDGLFGHYTYYYKKQYFPKLINDDAVPEVNKEFIRNMLTKPRNLYVFRHSALTEKSLILKEHVLRDHAGWTMTSKMPQVYIHYFGTESSKSLLEARGIVQKKDKAIVARFKQCPSCNEPNKPDNKFCAKLYLLQAVSPCLPTHGVQPSGIKEKTIKVKQKILSFRGKEYILQNSVVDQECNECGRLFRCPGVFRQRIYKDGTSKEVGKHKPEWHCLDHPNAIVNALETETLKDDPDLK